MQFFTLIAINSLLIIVGILASITIGVKQKTEIIGLSYLLGSSIISIVFLLFHWFLNLKLDQPNFLLSVFLNIILLSSFIIISKKTKELTNLIKSNKKKIKVNLSITEKCFFITIILLVAYSFLENYFWPITDWDAIAFYDFRARIMALNGNMLEGVELGYFFQYPPYTSFLHVFGYIFGTERVKIVYSLIYSSFLIVFYSLIRRKQTRSLSLILTLMLASTPMIFEHSTMAYSNLAFTSFFSIGIIYLWFYSNEGMLKDLVIGGLLVGFSTWVRSTEPFWILGVLLIIWGFLKHKKYFLISLALIGSSNLPNRIWRLFLKQLNNFSTTEILETESHSFHTISNFLSQNNSIWEILIRIFEVFRYLIITLLPDFLLLTLILLITQINNRKKSSIEILSLLILSAIVFGGTLIFSFTVETWNAIGGSVSRMCMIFFPLLLFIVGKDLKYGKK